MTDIYISHMDRLLSTNHISKVTFRITLPAWERVFQEFFYYCSPTMVCKKTNNDAISDCKYMQCNGKRSVLMPIV